MTEKPDTVEMDVPTFIRILEVARENVKSDAQLHEVVTNVIATQKQKTGGPLTMKDYSKFFVRTKVRE